MRASRTGSPGQPVRAQVSTGEPDGKIHCSRLELLYRNTYRTEVPQGDGHREVHKRKADVIVESHPLPGGVTGNHSVEFTVPPDAPGSAAGSVEWMVRAAKDRRMARDLSRTAPITVLVPAEPLAAWAERAPTDVSGVTIMTMDVTPRTAMSGTVISGRLEVRAVATNRARAVRVQLRRQRDDYYDLTDEEVVTERVLADDLVLPRGESRAWDFSLEVPADVSPSFEARHNSQHWYVEGLLDRRRAIDPTARVEILVHTI